MEETIKILSETEYNKFTSNMEIIERKQFFDGYVMYTFIEAKKGDKTFWFVKLKSVKFLVKTKYLMVQEEHIKMLNEIWQRNPEDFSMTMYYFLFED
jgi:hypothetical protein